MMSENQIRELKTNKEMVSDDLIKKMNELNL